MLCYIHSFTADFGELIQIIKNNKSEKNDNTLVDVINDDCLCDQSLEGIREKCSVEKNVLKNEICFREMPIKIAELDVIGGNA